VPEKDSTGCLSGNVTGFELTGTELFEHGLVTGCVNWTKKFHVEAREQLQNMFFVSIMGYKLHGDAEFWMESGRYAEG
jgi:hypothetical protein